MHNETILSVGEVLNNTFRVERWVASGGMGEVYEASHTTEGIDDRFAVKVIKKGVFNKLALELFKREARALQKVNHDSIVRSYLVQNDDQGRMFLPMEFVDGPKLSDVLLEYGPLEPPLVWRLARRLAVGLNECHRNGVVHRDLSPDNILLPDSDVERAKIIDFGISKENVEPGADGSMMEQQSTIIGNRFTGKYTYAAPEQFPEVGGQVDHRADMYSLCLVLAAAATGRPLPMGTTRDEAVAMRQSVPRLDAVPKQFWGLMALGLQPDPSRRPASVQIMVEQAAAFAESGELDRILGGEAGRTRAPDDQTVLVGDDPNATQMRTTVDGPEYHGHQSYAHQSQPQHGHQAQPQPDERNYRQATVNPGTVPPQNDRLPPARIQQRPSTVASRVIDGILMLLFALGGGGGAVYALHMLNG